MHGVKVLTNGTTTRCEADLTGRTKGAIIIIMQRLHVDDFVAHVQNTERLDSSFFLSDRRRR